MIPLFPNKLIKPKPCETDGISIGRTNKKFKNCKYKNTKKTTYTLTKLKKKSKCYVKVRAYKKSGNQKVYGKWSSPKSVKIKK